MDYATTGPRTFARRPVVGGDGGCATVYIFSVSFRVVVVVVVVTDGRVSSVIREWIREAPLLTGRDFLEWVVMDFGYYATEWSGRAD